MLSMELVLVLPIVIGLIFAAVEIGMIWTAGQRLDEAAGAGCRIAGFRGTDEASVRRHVENCLRRQALIKNYQLNVQDSGPNAEAVCVTVSVPMNAAAPDLLCMLGFSLKNRMLTAQAVMRKE